ncbi:MAG: class I SAM-dependent methyltransferase, partial [Gemmataceae bacterium]
VVDIGCNDGTLLKQFKALGVRTVGVEPTNIAKIARQEGIDVIHAPFTEEVARQIVEAHGQADLMTATNVFAHMAPLGEVMRGVERLIRPGGAFVTESHYLTHILDKVQYDSIYHEHIRSYTLKSLVHLFNMYDFSVVDAEVVQRYSGTVRVTAMKGMHPPRDSVNRLLREEQAAGIYEPHVYQRFRERVYRAKYQLLELAMTAKMKGQRFVGNSCPGRCSTLVNFTGLTPDLMPYIAEQPTSLKLGLHLPGTHNPVEVNDILLREQPDYVVLLAWHYADSIARQLRQRGLRSKLVIPLREVAVLEPDLGRSVA